MLTLTHQKKELGDPIEKVIFECDSPEKIWQKIVTIVSEHTHSLDEWTSVLLEAFDHGLDRALVINDGPTVDEVSGHCDQAQAQQYVETLLGDHNMVGWWLEHNLDDDIMTVTDDQGKELNILTLIPVDLDPSIDPEDHALFYNAP